MTHQGALLVPQQFTKSDRTLVDKYEDLLGNRNLAIINVQRFKIYMNALVSSCNMHLHDLKKSRALLLRASTMRAERLYTTCIRRHLAHGDFSMAHYETKENPIMLSCELTPAEYSAVKALVGYFSGLYKARKQNTNTDPWSDIMHVSNEWIYSTMVYVMLLLPLAYNYFFTPDPSGSRRYLNEVRDEITKRLQKTEHSQQMKPTDNNDLLIRNLKTVRDGLKNVSTKGNEEFHNIPRSQEFLRAFRAVEKFFHPDRHPHLDMQTVWEWRALAALVRLVTKQPNR